MSDHHNRVGLKNRRNVHSQEFQLAFQLREWNNFFQLTCLINGRSNCSIDLVLTSCSSRREFLRLSSIVRFQHFSTRYFQLPQRVFRNFLRLFLPQISLFSLLEFFTMRKFSSSIGAIATKNTRKLERRKFFHRWKLKICSRRWREEKLSYRFVVLLCERCSRRIEHSLHSYNAIIC